MNPIMGLSLIVAVWVFILGFRTQGTYSQLPPLSPLLLLSMLELSSLGSNQIQSCNSTGACNHVMSTVLQGNGTCINGICQFTECPKQTIQLTIAADVICGGNPNCHCPVNACGLPIIPGSSAFFYRPPTFGSLAQYGSILQGHACQYNNTVLCHCFCGVGTFPPQLQGCPFSGWWL